MLFEPQPKIAPPADTEAKFIQIKKLVITSFRGIEKLTWLPQKGLNIILGGGNVGKTTILDAISLLLNPSGSTNIIETDYLNRNCDSEFEIEAVIVLPERVGINQTSTTLWPWIWDGKDAKIPSADKEDATGEAAYRVRVRGTTDLDLVYEIVQPDETISSFTLGIRRAIGLVRLNSDDRNDKDLRLVQGSALDRLLSDKTLHARLRRELNQENLEDYLEEAAKNAFDNLAEAFAKKALPAEIGLGVTGNASTSIGSIVGLTAKKNNVELPLMSWGAGTRRLASLTIANIQQNKDTIAVIDEVERGLEPYRLRRLIKDLVEAQKQVFLTTHNAVTLSATEYSTLWYLDSEGKIGELPKKSISGLQQRDPAALLAYLAIIVEGDTELGFFSHLLGRTFEEAVEDHGIWITTADGNAENLMLLEAFTNAGLLVAGVVDDEGDCPERWKKVKGRLGDLLIQWPSKNCLESFVISFFPKERLKELIVDSAGEKTGMRLKSLMDRLQENGLEIADKSFESIEKVAGEQLREYIIAAASGNADNIRGDKKKEFKKHSSCWYKSKDGGQELAEKAIGLSKWIELKPHIFPFLNAIRSKVHLQSIADLYE